MTDPIVRFRDAMARAASNPPFDPTAVSLATSTPDGRPSCRIVLLHEVDERGKEDGLLTEFRDDAGFLGHAS